MKATEIPMSVSPGTKDLVAAMMGKRYTFTASAAIPEDAGFVELKHDSTPCVMTIADATDRGLLIIKDRSTNTTAHTVTLTTGTWNGTNKIATLDAANDCIAVYFDSAGNGTVLSNTGSVAFTGT